MKALFIITIGLIIFIAGLRLGMKAQYDMMEKQAEQEYIEQYMADHNVY